MWPSIQISVYTWFYIYKFVLVLVFNINMIFFDPRWVFYINFSSTSNQLEPSHGVGSAQRPGSQGRPGQGLNWSDELSNQPAALWVGKQQLENPQRCPFVFSKWWLFCWLERLADRARFQHTPWPYSLGYQSKLRMTCHEVDVFQSFQTAHTLIHSLTSSLTHWLTIWFIVLAGLLACLLASLDTLLRMCFFAYRSWLFTFSTYCNCCTCWTSL